MLHIDLGTSLQVLKTKDYIHVEQENPFEKINIQPRVKMMKSELWSLEGHISKF